MKHTALRLTRSSYKRKLIMFGVSIFASLALTATGFAAWVLSQDAKGDINGNITVGAIDEADIEISDLAFSSGKDSFVFEPQEGDTAGRVRNDGENFESLTAEINWSLSNYQSVGEIYVDLKIPASVKDAIDNDFLTLPEGLTFLEEESVLKTEVISEKTYYIARYTIASGLSGTGNLTVADEPSKILGTYTVTADPSDDTIKSASFTLRLTFGWGSEFGNENPGIYFDGTGKSIEYDLVKEALLTFKLALHGVEYDAATHGVMNESQLEAVYTANPIPNFHIEVTAKVN